MRFKDVSLTDGYKTPRTPGGALRPSELPTVYFFFLMCLLCFLNKFSFFPKKKKRKERMRPWSYCQAWQSQSTGL